MKLVKSIMTKNPCYLAGKKIVVKGLMLHSVGCPQPSASSFIKNWDSPTYSRACVHAFIDGNDGTIYQTLPWNYRGWHCGGDGNNTHIGVEMCEPKCIAYSGGAAFTCSDLTGAQGVAKRTYASAVELFASLCKEFSLDPLAGGVIISHSEGAKRGVASNHADPEHLWSGLRLPYTMDGFRKDVKAAMGVEVEKTGTQAVALKDMSPQDVVRSIGHLFTEDQKKSGVLASVSMAQFILESGYGKTELAQNANNCFGMKCSLSGNLWQGSAWDGVSVYQKATQEQNPDGTYVTVVADFRKYDSIEKSIADHSAYLAGAMSGGKSRYDGLVDCSDYRKAAQIIKNGGYATSLTYVEKLCNIIEKWNLQQFDVEAEAVTTLDLYRVRSTWEDAASQKGAFYSLENAKTCADENPGFAVYNSDGEVVYTSERKVPFTVKVSIPDLVIRTGPGVEYAATGRYTGIGVFTIVEVKSNWGRLKSGAGWISLKYTS